MIGNKEIDVVTALNERIGCPSDSSIKLVNGVADHRDTHVRSSARKLS